MLYLSHASDSKKLVVYIDDDKEDVEIFSDIFNSIENELQLKSFLDPNEALAFLQSTAYEVQSICLILIDINFPLTDGFKLVEKIKALEQLSTARITFLTTSSNPTDKDKAEALGAGYFTKPDKVGGIRALVSDIIEHCSGL